MTSRSRDISVWLVGLTCLIVWLGTAQGQNAPPDLVSWWPGDGNASDLVGTNNGMLLGSATAGAAGKVGQAFSFDGTNGLVQIPDSPLLKPTNLTITAWVLFSALDSAGSGSSPPGEQYIVFKQNSRSTDFEGYQIGKVRTLSGDAFSFMVSSASGQAVRLYSTTRVTTGVWYHVAGVRGSNYAQLYVNGQQESQANVSFPQDYGTNPLYFGSSGQSYWDHKFAGLLDEVSLYSRALSDLEITNAYIASAFGPAYGDITFFVGSDLHYGYTNSTLNCAEVCRTTLASMNGLPGQRYPAAAGGGKVAVPRGVLLIGDLTESGVTTDWTALTNDWGLNGERSLAFPVYEGYGNHDCGTPTVPEGIKARNPFRAGVSNLSSNGYHYSWDWDYLHLVCLNVYPGQSPGILDPFPYGADPRDSLAFLVDDLARTVGNSGRPVILYHHYGLDGFGQAYWTEQDRSAYFEAIKNYNVIAIFAGHDHLVNYILWRGVNTFNDGTVGRILGPTYIISFLVAHLTKTNLTVVERRLDGTWGNVFNVTVTTSASAPPPVSVLRVSRSGANLLLTYPLWAASYTLESATNPAPGSWAAVSAVPITNTYNLVVALPITVNPQYFRLRP